VLGGNIASFTALADTDSHLCLVMGAQSKEAVIPAWGLAVAGATGALFANALVYPLDMWVGHVRACRENR